MKEFQSKMMKEDKEIVFKKENDEDLPMLTTLLTKNEPAIPLLQPKKTYDVTETDTTFILTLFTVMKIYH